MNWILVTGGLGFIGSHTCVLLMEKSWNLVVLDNLSNSNANVVDKINNIASTKEHSSLIFVEGDIRDINLLNKLFKKYAFTGVIHFAALKSVAESNKYTGFYYDVNVKGTINILNTMRQHNCKNFIYSSSATVYGTQPPPVYECNQTGQNLGCWYAQNKYDVEEILRSESSNFNICILRYFNPIGAHPSGLIGEDPKGTPNNIFPYLLRVAKNINSDPDDPSNSYSDYKQFTIFGDDYDTVDGTCIRDYVHVMDLARGHIEVYDSLFNKIDNKLKIYNLGTGSGTSVLSMVNVTNEILVKNGYRPLPYIIGKRRDGDLVESYANVDLIYKEIGFKTSHNIVDMINDGLNFIGLKCVNLKP